MRSRARLLVAVVALVAALLPVGLAGTASAATCTYDPTTQTVAVAVADGETATIGRNGDAITLDTMPCDVATVSTTNTVVVTATGSPAAIVIDQSGGPFAPGATDEGPGSEIEFTIALGGGTPIVRIVGVPAADHVAVGADGVNLNADEATGDVDVAITGTAGLVVEGGDGDDVLSVAGGAGTGAASAGASLLGQVGDDLFVPGTGGSSYDGGEGMDTIDFGAIASGATVDLAAGTANGDGADTIAGTENVIGSVNDDDLTGDAQPNVLTGGLGDDTIDGGGEADTLLGGEGEDTVSFASSGRGITVDVRKGTAKGDGSDTLSGFENVLGSPKKDTIDGDGGPNSLDGAGGVDEITGADGTDELLGGDGNDLLFGKDGNDLLKGGNGKDQLDGGKGRHDICKGGADPDAFVNCENFPT